MLTRHITGTSTHFIGKSHTKLSKKSVHPLLTRPMCNGHYNRTPDLGKYEVWRNTWDLARHTILDPKVLDRNVTWLTKHKDTS